MLGHAVSTDQCSSHEEIMAVVSEQIKKLMHLNLTMVPMRRSSALR